MADVINIKNGPELALTFVIGHDGAGKGGRMAVGVAGGIPGPLDGAGKIPAGQLPPLDHDVGQAANQVAMLALPVTAPAVCVRTDFTPAHMFYLTADPAATLANWVDTGEFGAGGANPTALAGPVAVNGAANTFMRSDAAPAINVAVSYIWGGLHTFGLPSTVSTPSVVVGSSNPQLDLRVTTAAADTRRWNWATATNTLSFRALTDAGVASPFWTATRTVGAATSWDFFVPTSVVQNIAGIKQRLAMKLPGTQNDAPTAFGVTSTYLGLGGGEWGAASYRLIGFGYIAAVGQQYPAVIGYEETQTSGSTKGDLVFGTRPTNTNVAPTIAFRIKDSGQLQMAGLGTAAIPKLAFDSDSNTGLYSPAADEISLATAGVQRLTADATGQLLAGTGYVPAAALSLANKGYVDASVVSAVGAIPVNNGNFGAPVDHSGSGDVNIEPTDAMVHRVSATTGDIFVRLIDAPVGTVKIIKRMNATANGVHITPEPGSSGTIDGVQDIGMSAQYSHRMLISAGPSVNTNWSIIGSSGA